MRHGAAAAVTWLLLVAGTLAEAAASQQHVVDLDKETVWALPKAALHQLASLSGGSKHSHAGTAAGRSLQQAAPSYPPASPPTYGPGPVGQYGPAYGPGYGEVTIGTYGGLTYGPSYGPAYVGVDAPSDSRPPSPVYSPPPYGSPPPSTYPPPPYPPSPSPPANASGSSPPPADQPSPPLPAPPAPAPSPSPPVPPAPAPPASQYPSTTPPPAQGTPRPAGSQYFATPATTNLGVSATACSNIASNSGPFAYQFQSTTAAAWNAANPSSAVQVLAGDIAVTSVTASGCTQQGTGRLLQQSSNGVAVQYQVNLAPGATLQQAQDAGSSFQSQGPSLYRQGQFANDYGVSSASVTVGQPSLVTVGGGSGDSGDGGGGSSSSSSKLGLGIGIGIGVPLVLGAGYVFYRRWLERRRFGQYSHSLIEFGRLD